MFRMFEGFPDVLGGNFFERRSILNDINDRMQEALDGLM
jgi:hypothetical protein